MKKQTIMFCVLPENVLETQNEFFEICYKNFADCTVKVKITVQKQNKRRTK